MARRFQVGLGLALAGVIGIAALGAASHASAAGTCKTDATDGCERDGVACNPPAGGKCVTIKTPVPLSGPKLSCECRVPPPPKSSRLMIEPPDPCTTATGRQQLLKTGGQHALQARCGRTRTTTTTTHSNLPPPGYN